MDTEGPLFLQLYLVLKQSPGNILFSQQNDETSSWQDEPGVDFVRFVHELPLFLMYHVTGFSLKQRFPGIQPQTNRMEVEYMTWMD